MNQPTEKTLSEHRIQTSILAEPERKVLVWMAARTPRAITPDLLTGLGVLGLALCGMGYYLATRHWLFLVLVSVGLFINWVGDSLDGTLARYRKEQRPKFGYYLDHLADAFGISFMMFGLAYSGLVTPFFAWIIYALLFIASINTYLATSTINVFQISYQGMSTTEGRVALIIVNTLLIFVKEVTLFGFTTYWLNYAAVVGAFFFVFIIFQSAYRNLRSLDREERAKWKTDGVTP